MLSLFCASRALPQEQERAAQIGAANIGTSGLALPRFVSLRSGRVNVRVGPDSVAHAVVWTYTRQGLPVEIIEEYDNWRRIRDSNGDGGWVNQAFLSGKRTAMLAPWIEEKSLAMRAEPDEKGALVAEIEAGVIGELRHCKAGWCEIDIKADCDSVEPLDSLEGFFLMPQFLSDIFGFGRCVRNYRGWLRQANLWGVYPNEEF